MTVHHPAPSYPWQSPADPSPTTPLHCSNLLAESFVKLYSIIHPRATTEFVYRYSSSKEAYIITSFLLNSSPSSASGPTPEARAEELAGLQTKMAEAGMESVDLSDDEFAKSHVRHMVGGKKFVEHERIFRFGEQHSRRVTYSTLTVYRIPRATGSAAKVFERFANRLEYHHVPLQKSRCRCVTPCVG